jgi:hypothetical protein
MEELRAAARRQVKRVRRLKINVAAWVLGTILPAALWVLNEWQANGAFDRFGHELIILGMTWERWIASRFPSDAEATSAAHRGGADRPGGLAENRAVGAA